MPSTGLIGSMYILQNYENVTLIGFDGYDKKYDYGHYFQKQMIEQQNFSRQV